MRPRMVSLFAAVCLLSLLGCKSTPSTATADHIHQLIEQLGSKDFQEREKAAKELITVGEPALDAIRKATKSSDPEITKRAGLHYEY